MSGGLSEYVAVMTDSWNFMKKYFEPHDEEQYWEQLIDKADKIAKAHNKDFAASLILLIVDDIEQRWKEKTNNPYRQDVLETMYERLKRRRTT